MPSEMFFQQLKNPGQKVSVKSLDGNIVDFGIETGSVLETNEPELEFIVYDSVSPFIPHAS